MTDPKLTCQEMQVKPLRGIAINHGNNNKQDTLHIEMNQSKELMEKCPLGKIC